MKNKYLLAFVTMVLALASCQKVSDWMEKQDTGDFEFDDIWVDENYVEGWLNNCFTGIPGVGWWCSGGEPLWCLTDEGWSSLDAAGATSHRVYDGNFSSTAGWPGGRNIYSAALYRIRNINIFLHYILMPDTPVRSEDFRRRMIADAYVLRAYYMFEIFKEYGPLYLYNEDGVEPDEGHPEYMRFVTQLTDSYVNLRRVPAEDYVRWIIADCDRGLAYEDLPWRCDQGEGARMSRALAWTIKANALMWLASPLFNNGNDYWEEAYEMNKTTLELLKEHGYALHTKCTNTSVYGTGPANAFRQYHADNSLSWVGSSPSDTETIFAYGGSSGNYGGNWVGSRHTGIGGCGACPTQEMVDCYETIDGVPVLDLAQPYLDEQHLRPNFNADNTLYDDQHPYDNRDPRFEQCILHHGSPYTWDKAYNVDISADGRNYRSTLPVDIMQTRTGYYFCKTIPPNCTKNQPATGPGMRQYKMSEMILNFAECALNAGHLEEAREAVNEIRDRVGMPALPASLATDKEGLRRRLYNERRVELAFEETRYYDLRRRCRPEEEIPGIKYFTGVDVTYAGDWSAANYTRVQIREEVRHGYEPQCKLTPLPKGEVSNLKVITGVDFQNYGWE